MLRRCPTSYGHDSVHGMRVHENLGGETSPRFRGEHFWVSFWLLSVVGVGSHERMAGSFRKVVLKPLPQCCTGETAKLISAAWALSAVISMRRNAGAQQR